MQPREITELKKAIRARQACEALFVKAIHVDEALDGVTPRGGKVMVFELVGHPEAQCCYAWSSRSGKRTERFVVLQLPPVTSPESALQAAFAAKAEQQASSQTESLEPEGGAAMVD